VEAPSRATLFSYSVAGANKEPLLSRACEAASGERRVETPLSRDAVEARLANEVPFGRGERGEDALSRDVLELVRADAAPFGERKPEEAPEAEDIES